MLSTSLTFERDRETIFRSVELLIYVFDIESDNPEKDFDHFCGVLEAIEEKFSRCSDLCSGSQDGFS
jgi:Ras-related GTP-binding protein A/B